MNNKISEYSYESTLENAQTYQYSKFIGSELIKSYRLHRTKTLEFLNKALKPKQDQSSAVKDYIQNCSFDKYEKEELKKKISGMGKSKDILSLLLFMQHTYGIEDNFKDAVYKWLSIFIKKYEVSKKIYSEYDSRMVKTRDNYKEMDNYVLLAVNLALFYNKSGNLKFLSALLKLNDMLCSMKNSINQKNIPLLHTSITIELESIEKLLCNKRLEI